VEGIGEIGREARCHPQGLHREGRRGRDGAGGGGEGELVLESPHKLQPELGLQRREGPAGEIAGAALPGGAIGIAGIAEVEIEGSAAVEGRQVHVGRGVGHLPHLGAGPPGIRRDLAEGGERLARYGPAQAMLQTCLQPVAGNRTAADQTHVVASAEHGDAVGHVHRHRGCLCILLVASIVGVH
jgi:hypothetical protein